MRLKRGPCAWRRAGRRRRTSCRSCRPSMTARRLIPRAPGSAPRRRRGGRRGRPRSVPSACRTRGSRSGRRARRSSATASGAEGAGIEVPLMGRWRRRPRGRWPPPARPARPRRSDADCGTPHSAMPVKITNARSRFIEDARDQDAELDRQPGTRERARVVGVVAVLALELDEAADRQPVERVQRALAAGCRARGRLEERGGLRRAGLDPRRQRGRDHRTSREVLGIGLAAAKDLGPRREADAELEHANVRPAGGDEVAELVDQRRARRGSG